MAKETSSQKLIGDLNPQKVSGGSEPGVAFAESRATKLTMDDVSFNKKRRRERLKSATTWSEWGDLNSRPLGPEPSALPTALHPETALSL